MAYPVLSTYGGRAQLLTHEFIEDSTVKWTFIETTDEQQSYGHCRRWMGTIFGSKIV